MSIPVTNIPSLTGGKAKSAPPHDLRDTFTARRVLNHIRHVSVPIAGLGRAASGIYNIINTLK